MHMKPICSCRIRQTRCLFQSDVHIRKVDIPKDSFDRWVGYSHPYLSMSSAAAKAFRGQIIPRVTIPLLQTEEYTVQSKGEATWTLGTRSPSYCSFSETNFFSFDQPLVSSTCFLSSTRSFVTPYYSIRPNTTTSQARITSPHTV